MFKFFANISRPKRYLIISVLGLMLLSAGFGVALEIKSRNLASKQPVVAPLEIPESAVAETPVPAPATQVAAKVTTTKKPTPPTTNQSTGPFCPVSNGKAACPIGKLVLSQSTFILKAGSKIDAAVTIRTETNMPIRTPSSSKAGDPNPIAYLINPNPQIQLNTVWVMGIQASTEAKPGTYQIEVEAKGQYSKDLTIYKAMVTVTIVEKSYFEIAATRLDDRTEPGYFAVRIKYSRIGGYSNNLPEPNITMQPDEDSCELFEDGTDQYVFECDIEEPSPSYSITFSVTDNLGVRKSTNISISWP